MAKKPADRVRKVETKERRPLKQAPTKRKLEKAAKPKAEPKVTAPAPARGGVKIAFICSECYEDFFFRGETIGETITCPECLHVGKKPDADFLSTVRRHKSGEKSALAMAMVALVLTLGLALGYIHFSSGAQQIPENESLQTILLASSALLAPVGIILAVRYEKNRWEIYF